MRFTVHFCRDAEETGFNRPYLTLRAADAAQVLRLVTENYTSSLASAHHINIIGNDFSVTLAPGGRVAVVVAAHGGAGAVKEEGTGVSPSALSASQNA